MDHLKKFEVLFSMVRDTFSVLVTIEDDGVRVMGNTPDQAYNAKLIMAVCEKWPPSSDDSVYGKKLAVLIEHITPNDYLFVVVIPALLPKVGVITNMEKYSVKLTVNAMRKIMNKHSTTVH